MTLLQRALRKALILSPAASHPQDFGNRRRVYQTAAHLRQDGYEIHFLLYPMEPDWMARVQESARAMRAEWDSFTILPASRQFPLQSPAIGQHHQIDEWWDPTIGTYLSWLFAHEFFDVFVVNYAFLAKALEYSPKGTIKVLETHDRFSGRKELLIALGARIESFYTTEAEERVAIERSDIVVAIKDSEAKYYRSLADREVVSVPFWLDQEGQAVRPYVPAAPDSPLRVGFIGALNVVNVANMTQFLRCFEKYERIYAEPIVLDIAGDVCLHLNTSSSNVRLLGRVESLDHFYDQVDVVIVPMALSTGLKIKVAEALSYGKAIASTQNGFDGFPPTDEFHSLASFPQLCRALIALSIDRDRLEILRSRTEVAAQLARGRSILGYRTLSHAIARRPATIVFVTDWPIFDANRISGERSSQWCQLCSDLGATVLIYLGEQPIVPGRVELRTVDVMAVPPTDGQSIDVLECLRELARSREIVEIVISVGGDLGVRLWETIGAVFPHITLDTWIPALANVASKFAPLVESGLWFSPEGPGTQQQGRSLSTTAFRHLPTALNPLDKAERSSLVALVLCDPDEFDRGEIEAISSTAFQPSRFATIDLASSDGLDFNDRFLDSFRALTPPSAIIAIGRHARAAAVCRSLALSLRIACIHVSSERFPVLVVRRDGFPHLCGTLVELARLVADGAVSPDCASQDRDAAGWDIYSQIVAGRASATGRAPGALRLT